MGWFRKSFDQQRAKEAEEYFSSDAYARRVRGLSANLKGKESGLSDKRIAFGSGGVIMSQYLPQFRGKNKISGVYRRPFSQEVLDWLKANTEEVCIWTSKARERLVEQLGIAGLSVDGIRIIDYPEYLEKAGRERLDSFYPMRLNRRTLEGTAHVEKNHTKLPSIMGVDFLVDKSVHKVLAPGFNEPVDPYISVRHVFQPKQMKDFVEDNELAQAAYKLVELTTNNEVENDAPYR